VRGRVSTRAGDDRNATARARHPDPDQLTLLARTQCRRLAGRSSDDEGGGAIGDLQIA
jgi:hypothetical protein